MKYAYYNLRSNAKHRGKEFDLTFEQFKKFAIETDYFVGKGKKKDSYSIDRIDNNKGYTLDNIQIMTLSENSKKYTKTLDAYYDDLNKRVVATVKKSKVDIDSDEIDNMWENISKVFDDDLNTSKTCECGDDNCDINHNEGDEIPF